MRKIRKQNVYGNGIVAVAVAVGVAVTKYT